VEKHKPGATPVNVKLPLPPRQSRGFSQLNSPGQAQRRPGKAKEIVAQPRRGGANSNRRYVFSFMRLPWVTPLSRPAQHLSYAWRNEQEFSANGELSNCKLSHGRGAPQRFVKLHPTTQAGIHQHSKDLQNPRLCVLFPPIPYTRSVSGTPTRRMSLFPYGMRLKHQPRPCFGP
jgi:hypothetical protein